MTTATPMAAGCDPDPPDKAVGLRGYRSLTFVMQSFKDNLPLGPSNIVNIEYF